LLFSGKYCDGEKCYFEDMDDYYYNYDDNDNDELE